MTPLRFLLIASFALGASFSTVVAEEEEIIYRAKGGRNIFKSAEKAAQHDRSGIYDAPIRAQYDANVNRTEGLATTREELTTWVLSLYCDMQNPGVIHFGHSLAE